MVKIKTLWTKYREVLTYLIFGGLTTVVNVGLFMILTACTSLTTSVANAIALAASILFAYITNKLWVFESKKGGLDALKEFILFIACRIGTGLMDQLIVVRGIDTLGLAIGLNENQWYILSVKIFANILVILANYVFSKLLIFRKKA